MSNTGVPGGVPGEDGSFLEHAAGITAMPIAVISSKAKTLLLIG